MNPSLISCIVPVYNGERYLQETLNSILAQTYRPIEIVVCDDGSTDGTASLIKEYGDQVFCQWQPNSGLSAARNLGIRAAQGEFLAFLDADDIWYPDKLMKQIQLFQERSDLDYCVTQIRNFLDSSDVDEQRRFKKNPQSLPQAGFSAVTLLAKRDLFNKVGLFKTSLKHSAEMDWFVRVQENKAIGDLIPEVLVARRLHPTNRSRLHARVSREEHLLTLKQMLDRRRRQEVLGG